MNLSLGKLRLSSTLCWVTLEETLKLYLLDSKAEIGDGQLSKTEDLRRRGKRNKERKEEKNSVYWKSQLYFSLSKKNGQMLTSHVVFGDLKIFLQIQ